MSDQCVSISSFFNVYSSTYRAQGQAVVPHLPPKLIVGAHGAVTALEIHFFFVGQTPRNRFQRDRDSRSISPTIFFQVEEIHQHELRTRFQPRRGHRAICETRNAYKIRKMGHEKNVHLPASTRSALTSPFTTWRRWSMQLRRQSSTLSLPEPRRQVNCPSQHPNHLYLR